MPNSNSDVATKERMVQDNMDEEFDEFIEAKPAATAASQSNRDTKTIIADGCHEIDYANDPIAARIRDLGPKLRQLREAK